MATPALRPQFPIPIERIPHLIEAPEPANVIANWPLIDSALRSLQPISELACIAALATIRVECPSFKPQAEKYNGDPAVYFRRYDGRNGNDHPGDGYRYRGRGYSQLTFKNNYSEYGRLIGVDLVADPDEALEPNTSAALFAAFFYEKKLARAADAQNWPLVRRLWNGGYNGLEELQKWVSYLNGDLHHP